MTENLVKLSGSVPAELHTELKIWAMQNRVKMQDMILQAMIEFRDTHVAKKGKSK